MGPPGLSRSKTDLEEQKKVEKGTKTISSREKAIETLKKLTSVGKKHTGPKLSISRPRLSPLAPVPYRSDFIDLEQASPVLSPTPTLYDGFGQWADSSIGRLRASTSPEASRPRGVLGADFCRKSYSEPKVLFVRRDPSVFVKPDPVSSDNRQPKTQLPSMEALRLQSRANLDTKMRAIQQAKEMENLVAERAKRTGQEPPQYDFFELIGKGSYGRVFKGKNRRTNTLVAIKIIDIDKQDFDEGTSKNLEETIKEINILQQLKFSKARPYVNLIEEARNVHNELWIVSEYASGGSVHTLMKPTMMLPNPGLEEKYIIAIARELALGLKFIHEAGVIHRDLKCTNILVNEDGTVQLCDFGVSGTLGPDASKRTTIVGTPNWMAPEMQKEWVKDADPSSFLQPKEILYGSEVDIWAYGCTLYEMATGFPPHHKVSPLHLPETGVPRLEGSRYSEDLKDLLAFVLQPDPKNRPTPDQILQHPYLENTTKMYPSVTLVQLVERYYRWEQAGGARASLFNPYGAQAPDPLAPEPEDDDDDWTFSTTDEFEKHFSGEFTDLSNQMGSEDNTPVGPPPEDRFAQLEANIREQQVKRGGRRLAPIFDKDSTGYRNTMGADRPPSDLVLRDFNPGAPNRETVIDLDFAAPSVVEAPTIDLGVATLKASRMNRLREFDLDEEDTLTYDQNATRRATRDWKFPAMTAPDKPNRRTVEWTFDAAMAEANIEPLPSDRDSQIARQRETLDLSSSLRTAPLEDNRRTRDFVFPPREPEGSSLSDQGPHLSSSPILGPTFRPGLRHATTEPIHAFSEYAPSLSRPDSPLRTSIIDLDMAMVDDYRPSTSGSGANSVHSVLTSGTAFTSGNPFDLEDQMRLSQSNDRTSYHTKSQSEPYHRLLASEGSDERVDSGYHPPGLHSRGASVQVHDKQHPSNRVGGHVRQNTQQSNWDLWNHAAAYGMDDSPPASDLPLMEEENPEELWEIFERELGPNPAVASWRAARRNASSDEEIDGYSSSSSVHTDSRTSRRSRVSVGPNGKPLVEFSVPRGPEPEVLLGDADPEVMTNALLRSAFELRDGVMASRELLSYMRQHDFGGSATVLRRNGNGNAGFEGKGVNGNGNGNGVVDGRGRGRGHGHVGMMSDGAGEVVLEEGEGEGEGEDEGTVRVVQRRRGDV